MALFQPTGLTDTGAVTVTGTVATTGTVVTSGTSTMEGNQQTGSYPDEASVPTSNYGPVYLDQFENLQIRGPVLTDEYSLRSDFPGTSLPQNIWTSVTSGSGSTVAVANSVVSLTSGTQASAKSQMSTLIDYGPLQIYFYSKLSQRIANQTSYLSLRDNLNSPTIYAEFQFSGTSNTQVICETATDATASGKETTAVALPNGMTTATYHAYNIEVGSDRVTFLVDNTMIAEHTRHIPNAYDSFYGFLAVVNSNTTASATTLDTDYVFFNNFDKVDVQANLAGSPLGVEIRANDLCVSATGTAGSAVTATLPAFGSLFHHISNVHIIMYSTAARTGTSTPVVVTSTNLPGNPSLTFPTAGAIGTISEQNLQLPGTLKALAAGTNTTIVCPATTNVIWRINVVYHVGA